MGFLVYVASTAAIMVGSINATKDYEVHDSIMTDTEGHTLQVAKAEHIESDPSHLMKFTTAQLTKISTIQLEIEDDNTFIGHVSAVTKAKDTVVVYFQDNPIYSKFTLSTATDGETGDAETKDGEARRLRRRRASVRVTV